MNDGFAYADIVVLALVAGFILLRLRNMLGKDVELPPGVEARRARQTASEKAHPEHVPPITPESPLPEDSEQEKQWFAQGAEASLSKALKAIKAQDPAFRLRDFIEGAKVAFEMVLEAYSKADRKTLKMLLSNELFEQFMNNIKELKAAGHSHETTLIAIRSAILTKAQVDGSVARLVVSFVSEQVTLVRDKEGSIVEGDPSRTDVVEDVWMFERDLRSQDPNWKLVDADA